MKQLITLAFVGYWLANASCFAQMRWSYRDSRGEQNTTVVIKTDGSSIVTNVMVQSRAATEQGIRMWEKWKKRSEDAGDDTEASGLEAKDKATEDKPYTDQELREKIRETDKIVSEQQGTDPQNLETIELKTNTVRLVSTRSFASLSNLLAETASFLGGNLLMENVRFETTNAQLRVTLSPSPGIQRYAKGVRQQWKNSGAIMEIRFIFPGKVLSSGLPNTKDHATWVRVEGEKTDTLDALIKLYDAPVIILCEPGGLKLEAPLDSKKLRRSGRRGDIEATDDVPITDAGPGFVAEGISVATSTTYYFPGGEKFLKNAEQFGMNPTGTIVRAKIFAPKGRTFKSVSGVRVIKATDDKGREIIAPSSDSPSDTYSETTVSMSGSRNKSAPMTITLQLALPAADASSISELSAEAIALTIGKWNDFSITNLQASATNAIDLGSILPGATCTITKFTSKNRQLQVQVKLKGPKEIRQLDLQCQTPTNPEFGTYANDMNLTTKGSESTRTVNVQGYGYGGDRTDGAPVILVIRNPVDSRRERVRFTLKDLDLF